MSTKAAMRPPFIIQTCEAMASAGIRRIPFEPRSGDALDRPFLLDDPFGLRRAILPVFHCEPGGQRIFGLGTATHVDGWGAFLTADHVVDFLRGPGPILSTAASELGTAVLLLGRGLVVGKVSIPKDQWASVVEMQSVATEADDPLAYLRNGSTHRVEIDICRINTRFHAEATVPESMPVNATAWQPTIDEWVLACGYPQLTPSEMRPDLQQELVVDGLYGCYGRITATSRGDSAKNPTRVFEVEADWPFGMSGGPVFNSAGEVVGIVSKGIDPSADGRGVGYATCLSWVPRKNELLPSLDLNAPGCRLGVAVLRSAPWNLGTVCQSMDEAVQAYRQYGPEYRIVRGSHRIGTDEFVFCS